MDVAALTRIDQHEIVVEASPEEAWAAVVAVFVRHTMQPMWRALARALRCEPGHASGHPASTDATVPGFRVVRSSSPDEWALEGRHFFSRYALTFRVAPTDAGHCRVSAASSAEFPGHQGTAYRALVIGSGGHVLGVRSILRRIKTQAEHPPGGARPHRP